MSHGQLRADVASMVARFAVAHLGTAPRRLGQRGRVRLRRHTRPRAPGHVGVLQRRRADVRPRRQVPLLLVEPGLRSRLQRLRQQLVVPQLHPHRRGAPCCADTPSPLAPRTTSRARTRRTKARRKTARRTKRRRTTRRTKARRTTRRRTRRLPSRSRWRSTSTASSRAWSCCRPRPATTTGLQAVAGKILYRRQPRTGSGEEKSALVYYDLEEREEKTVLPAASTATR